MATTTKIMPTSTKHGYVDDAAYATSEAKTNRFAKAMQDSLDEMGGKWNALLANANRNANAAKSASEQLHMSAETQQAIENDQAVDAETELKHSIREDERFGEDARRVNQTNGFVSKAALEQALKDRKTIRDIFLDPANKELLKLPPDIMGDTFVSDASYGGTEENTTVCIRSMAAQALMDLISQNLGRPLTVQDTLLISQEIAGLTDRPECYYCYVATDRRAYRDFLGQYLDQRNEVIKKYKAGADKTDLYTEFLGGRKSTANMRARFNMWLNAVDNGTDLIDGNDLASLENLFAEVDSLRDSIIEAAAEVSGVDAGKLNIVNGNVKYTKAGKQITATTLNALMKSNPVMADSINRYMQLTDATAYAQSASWAKKMKGYAAYNGHILNWSQKRVNDLNKHYGLRMYSFSDFSPAFILENMQMVTDAAVRGLNMLGYTKEMDFAEIFAPSGMNINISTFAYEQGGEVMEDYKQGASWERAKALRDKHPNVGIVMVATSDNILEWALQQDWVDVVIPYHLVRTGTDVAEYFGYKNYTGVSADGKGLTFAEKNKGKSKKEKVTSVSPVEHRNDLISYVDALDRYGLTPRFAQWLNGLEDYRAGKISPMQFREMNPNYMKLVNETRRSYADTDPVQPKFNMEAAQESIQQMIREGGYYTPVGGTMEAQFEIAGTVADKIRGTEADVKRSPREIDAEYEKAYEELDESRARKLVREAAIAAGYNPLKLYHGTTSFGFTKVDPSKSDDGISLFATDNDLVAETYAGEDARIKTIGSMDGMTVDKLMAMEGEPLLRLLHRYGDDAYQIVSNEEIRELVSDEGVLIRRRVIPEVERRINNLREEFNDFSMNPERENAIIKAYEAVVDALDRLSYAKYYEQANNLYIAYDDALRELRKLDESEASLHSYSVGNDIHSRYYSMLNYLSGDLFKVEGEWSTEYITRSQAIDTLLPRMFKGIYELYGKTDNLFEVDAKGSSWRHIEGSFIGRDGFVSTRDVAAYAKANGFDGVHFKNIIDVGGMANYVGESDVYTFFNPGDIKSADTFTYDDNMDLIPLSERFNREDDDVRYSIRNVDGESVVWVSEDITKDKPSGQKYTEFIAAYLEKHIGEVYTIIESGRKVYLGEDLPGEYTESKYTRRIRNKGQEAFMAKNIASPSLGEAIEIATNRRWEETMHPQNKDAKYGIYKYSTKFSFPVFDSSGAITDVRAFTADLLIRNASDGKKYLYDVQKIKNDAITADRLLKRESARRANSTAKLKGIISEDSVAQMEKDVKSQLRDPYTASDREMLVSAFDNASLSVEDRNRLNGYKKKIGELDKKQRMLEQTTDRINMLEASDAEKNREEIIKLQNTAQIYAMQIERADAELLKIEALAPIRKLAEKQRATYIREVKAGYDERLQKYKQKQDEKTRERIQKIKDREAAKRKDMRKEMDRLKKVAEPNLKEKYRNKILSDVKKLYSWVATPTNKGHVPNFLKAPLGEFLQTIDYSSINYLKSAKPGIKDISMAEALENLRRALANVHNQKSIEEGAQEQFDYMDLPAQYLEQLDVFVGDVKEAMQNAADVTKTPLMLLNSNQLEYLSEAIAILKHSVEKMNENFNKNQFESPRSASNATINDMYKLKAKTKTNKALEAVNSTYNWKNATPIYAFQRMGAGGKAVFEGMQDGWDKMAQNSATLIEYAEKAFTSQQAKAWSKDIKTITLASGEKVQITASQIMSLYCLNKRTQAVGHLLGGGMRVGEIKLGKGNTLNQAENYVLTEDDIGKMISTMTAEQRAVADKLQTFMNTVCTDWGNEISMKRFGYKMFTEQYYFPIEVDTNNLQRGEDKLEQKNSMFRLLNMSAMKPLTPKANNALVVRDIFDVFTEHTSDIAKYNALALPILDMIRWYQYTEKSDVYGEDGMPTGQNKVRSTRKALEHAYGGNATQYIRKFMADLNAEHDGGRNDGVLQKLMGNAKAASVGWNARVYFLQVTSLPRAAYAINPKYLLKGLAKWKSLNPVNAIKGTDAQDKIGILKWKSLGFYNTDIARSTRSMVRRDDGFLAKIRDYGMRPAGWGDNWVSNILYEAAKAEMKDKHPSVKEGTEAYDKLLNKRVREIVYKTQVVDSTMTRSDLMRGKGLMQLFTSFMSEPTLTINMLNESIQEAVANRRMGMTGKENLKSVGGKAMKAATVFVVSATFSAIVEALFDAIRDDDEYETFMEKFMQGLFGEKMKDADGAWGKFKALFDGNIGDNVNIFGMLPLIKEVVSFLQGYEENSMVTQVAKQFTDFTKSIDAWKQGNRPLYDVIYKGFKVIGSGTGIGVQNVSRDGVGLYNTFLADAWGTPKVQTYENTKNEAAEAFYAAVSKGDMEKAKWIVERAALNGYTEIDFTTKMNDLIKRSYLEGEIDSATATKHLIEYGNIKTKDDAYWKIKEWDNADNENYTKYGELRSAITSGNRSATTTAYNELVKHGVAESDVNREIAKLYNDGTATTILSLQMRSNSLYTSGVKLKADGEIHKDDFDDFITAIVNGSGIETEISKLRQKGYTTKQCMSAINGAFGNEGSIYRKMEKYNGREANILLDRILDAYEALGLDRQDEIEWIEENWKKVD